jgi:aerobic-type carbon monoxide dehydrogenase small subunit (CoxS/CutS family)
VIELHTINVIVNGAAVQRQVEPRLLLSDFLRGELGLTGTHVGCEHGICGACTVLLNGEAARACLIFAVQADGQRIDTVEGLSDSGSIRALQDAFAKHHALQCGFCTPGMLVIAHDFLKSHPSPTEEEIREAMSAALCRCTGYLGILRAVTEVARGGSYPDSNGSCGDSSRRVPSR